MRWVIVALFVLNLAPRALAADLDILRGSEPVGPAFFTNWSGFYAGGHFDYGSTTADFSGATHPLISSGLTQLQLENIVAPSEWPVLGSASTTATGFGGFVGYNTVYLAPTARIVFGVEANWDQASLSLYAPNSPLSRVVPDGSNTVSISASGSVTDLNFGTLRVRTGWAVGNFLPYAFAGFAAGQANVNIAETTTVIQKSPPGTFVFPATAGKNNEWLYGFTVGGGLDYALTHHIFVRGEYEYVQFQTVAGTDINVNTVRVGAGLKF